MAATERRARHSVLPDGQLRQTRTTSSSSGPAPSPQRTTPCSTASRSSHTSPTASPMRPGRGESPHLGYPELPPNWESSTISPSTASRTPRVLMRSFQELDLGWGSRRPKAHRVLVPALAPRPAATRGRDRAVRLLAARPGHLHPATQHGRQADRPSDRIRAEEAARNTVFVFASDHGEYAGAHGFLSGKIGTAYEEAIRLPLIVTDPSRRFTRGPDTPRKQLASSVDMAPMLVTLGNRGSIGVDAGQVREDLRRASEPRRRAAQSEARRSLITSCSPPTSSCPARSTTCTLRRTSSRCAPTEVKLVTYSHWAPGTTRRSGRR